MTFKRSTSDRLNYTIRESDDGNWQIVCIRKGGTFALYDSQVKRKFYVNYRHQGEWITVDRPANLKGAKAFCEHQGYGEIEKIVDRKIKLNQQYQKN